MHRTDPLVTRPRREGRGGNDDGSTLGCVSGTLVLVRWRLGWVSGETSSIRTGYTVSPSDGAWRPHHYYC